MTTTKPFKPVLIIVDFQHDFCPPSGSLAVPNGRAIASCVNTLLSLPFALKIATQDWHPPDHISFAANHPAPDNKPFESFASISNPSNPSETMTSRLWPVHCVQDTPGAELVPELNVDKVDQVVKKGMDKRVEMYSAFAPPFRKPTVCESGLQQVLVDAEASHVFVVGLAADYCVKATALDAAEHGFETVVVQEGTCAVDGASMPEIIKELESARVKFVSLDGPEVQKVRDLGKTRDSA
jgi:nicotinamidase-related amidase